MDSTAAAPASGGSHGHSFIWTAEESGAGDGATAEGNLRGAQRRGTSVSPHAPINDAGEDIGARPPASTVRRPESTRAPMSAAARLIAHT